MDKFGEEYEKEWVQASQFFGLTQRSHFFDTVIRLHKICENHKDSINIYRLLDFAEENVAIFSTELYERRQRSSGYYNMGIQIDSTNHIKVDMKLLKEYRSKFATVANIKLRLLRNRAIAHIDTETVKRKIEPFEKYDIDDAQIETIIEDLDSTLNLLSAAYNGQKYDKDLPRLESSMKRIMALIRIGLKASSRNT